MLSLLVRASLEGAVLAACVWLVCRALPRMSPGVRALLWWCVAAKFVVALVWLTPIGVPVLPGTAAGAPVATAAAPPLSPPEAAGAANGPALPPAPGSGAPAIPWTALLVGAWALGVGISLLRTLHGWRRTQAVVARSLPADEGLHAVVRELSRRLARGRRVDLRVSAEVESPLIVGVRRPVILVPARGFAALTPDQQRMALGHELAHLGRGDMWLGCVPAAAERCFFFHPLARLAVREYAFWREAACDEAVLATLDASPQSYGRMLLALGVSRRTATFSAAGAAWSFQNLKRRITMLDRTSPPSFGGRALAAVAVAAAIMAIAPVRAVARDAAPSSQIATPAENRRAASGPAAAPAMPAAAVAMPAGPERPAPRAAETADPLPQEELQFVFFRLDGNTTMTGGDAIVERAMRHRRSDEPLLWFRYGGQEYVVRDPGALREFEELWKPAARVGGEQGRVGSRMGEIGAVDREHPLYGEMKELERQMDVLGPRMTAAAERADSGMGPLVRRAVESGAAVQVESGAASPERRRRGPAVRG